MNLFKQLFVSLNKKRVKYLVAGGVAVNLYGVERATADIDLVVKLSRDNVGRFIEAAKELELIPRVPVKLEDFADVKNRNTWIKEKNMMVFTLLDKKTPFFSLDIFVEVPFDFEDVYARRVNMKFEGVKVSVVPVRDLINMKKDTGRPQDKADVYYLSRIAKEWESWKNEK